MSFAEGFAVRIGEWELLAASLEPLLKEMPHLQPSYDHLQDLIAQVRDLGQRQEGTRELTREQPGAAAGLAIEEPGGPPLSGPDLPEPDTAHPEAG